MDKYIFSMFLGLMINICNAKENQGQLSIIVEVTCNCPVNGIIVPIHNKACVPECHRLQKNKDYGSSNIVTKNDITTVTY